MPKTAPYGTWRSPITPGLITAKQVGLASPWLDGGDRLLGREPAARGRAGDAAAPAGDGPAEEVTPAPFNMRTRVHEYGGGAYTARGGLVVASEFRDQRLYRLERGRPPRPLTPESGARAALRRAGARSGARARARGARGPPGRRRAA